MQGRSRKSVAHKLEVERELSLPRVEQSYLTLYPQLDVDEPLSVHFSNEDEEKNSDFTSSINHAASPGQAPSGHSASGGLAEESSLPAFSETLKDLGYQRVPKFSVPSERMLRNDPIGKEQYPEALLPNSPSAIPGAVDEMDLCEYDMDEQDVGVLGYLGAVHQFHLSAELFEIVMHTFELEAFKLELLMPPRASSVGQGGIDDTQQCIVCNGADSENGNAIIFCDGCDIAVHQDCYGVPFIPERQWLCRRCMVSRGFKAACMFCPQKLGAFKQTDTNQWAHVLCALWIPELTFKNAAIMEPISSVERIPRGRWKLSCYICKQRQGACIQCVNPNCFQAFHASCAQAAGLYMVMTAGVQGALNDKSTLSVYCDRHTPADAGILVDVLAARKALELEAAIKDSQTSESLKGPRFPYWRTASGTFIVPQILRKAVQKNIWSRFKVDITPILLFMSRYWTLKRDAHGGLFSRRLRLVLDANKYAYAERLEKANETETAERELARMYQLCQGIQSNLHATTSRSSKSSPEPTGSVTSMTDSAPSSSGNIKLPLESVSTTEPRTRRMQSPNAFEDEPEALPIRTHSPPSKRLRGRPRKWVAVAPPVAPAEERKRRADGAQAGVGVGAAAEPARRALRPRS